MTTTDPALLGATELLRLYARKALSPVEAVAASLARIDRLDPRTGAFALVDHEGASRAAKESEARWQRGAPIGELDGVPTTIKDLSFTKGWVTRRGSRTTEGIAPDPVDAPFVARLREAGAVFLGKTTTPEFGWKGVTDNPLGQIARNPWNLGRTAGGSSGGAAVAAALGMGVLHQGSDGGGSIRMPAGFSGIVGLKPTYGRVPAWPPSPYGTVSHTGPMTRTVTDSALMLGVMAKPDVRDWSQLPVEVCDYRIGLEAGIRGLRIAASADLGYATVDPEIRAAFEEATRVLVDLGAVVEARHPGFADCAPLFKRHWYGAASYVVGNIPEEKRSLLDPGLREIAAEGARQDATTVHRTRLERAAFGAEIEQFLADFDLLVTPTLPLLAFEAGVEVPQGGPYGRWIDWTPFSIPFNLGQQPALTIPMGLSRSGLPMGLQIVGPKYADHRVLIAARAFESAKPFAMPSEPRGG